LIEEIYSDETERKIQIGGGYDILQIRKLKMQWGTWIECSKAA